MCLFLLLLRKQLVDMYIWLTWICSGFNVNDKLIIRQKLTGLNRKKIVVGEEEEEEKKVGN
jgi:hypothetical protein